MVDTKIRVAALMHGGLQFSGRVSANTLAHLE